MGATCVTPRLSERALKKCIQSSSIWLLGVSNVAQIAGEGRGSLVWRKLCPENICNVCQAFVVHFDCALCVQELCFEFLFDI